MSTSLLYQFELLYFERQQFGNVCGALSSFQNMINFITLNLLKVGSGFYRVSPVLIYFPMCEFYTRNSIRCIDSSYNEVIEA